MKLTLYLLLGFLFMFSLPLCVAQDKKIAIRKLQADEAHTWDFGQVEEGKIYTHSFTLKNTGKNPFKIVSVQTSCGCATAMAKSKILIPGAKTEIEVQFNSEGYSGPVEQLIYVSTNRILLPVINFKIKADVIKKEK